MGTMCVLIDSVDKIKVHMICPVCGKDLFPDKRLLLEDLRNKFQSKDLAVINKEVILEKKDNSFSFSSDCCNLKMIYTVNIPVEVRNVTENKEFKEIESPKNYYTYKLKKKANKNLGG